MDATAHAPQREPHRSRRSRQRRGRWAALLRLARVNGDDAFAWWIKTNNDWVFNLAGTVAYNLLLSIFPILLVLLIIAGVIIGGLAPSQQAGFQAWLAGAVPGGQTIVNAVVFQLRHIVGVLLIVGIAVAAFTGSRLFIVLENCFGIIFRLRGRDFIHQNLMAFGMFLLYVVLIPLVFLGSLVPPLILTALGPAAQTPLGDFITQLLGILVSVGVACLLLGASYVVVPNRPVRWGDVWPGTLVAAMLLVIYELLFPFYESFFLRPNNYGSVAGFVVVIVIFLYYLGFIVLIGAEVNSWVNGQRETYGDLAAVLHEVQAHGTIRGAAGPTAGQPREDRQHHKGASAMRDEDQALHHEHHDHRTDAQPPRPDEAQPRRLLHGIRRARAPRWHETPRDQGAQRGDGELQQPAQRS